MFYDFVTKYTDIFFVEKMRGFSFFSTKSIGLLEILTFEILIKTLTNNIFGFEQPGPNQLISITDLSKTIPKTLKHVPAQNNSKTLDLSCKTDLEDFQNYFGKERSKDLDF